jgi:hypothetical protein
MTIKIRAARAATAVTLAMAVAALSVACSKKAGEAGQGARAVVEGPFTTQPTETSIPPAPEKISPDTERFFVTWAMKSAAKGDKVLAVLVAVDVGAAAAPNTEVLRTEVTVPDDGDHWGNFTFKKPTAGWPAGSYRVDVTHGAAAIGGVTFRVE